MFLNHLSIAICAVKWGWFYLEKVSRLVVDFDSSFSLAILLIFFSIEYIILVEFRISYVALYREIQPKRTIR